MTLTGYLALLLWDVFHYWWQNGYDARASARLYTDSIRLDHRIPSSAAGVAHDPPLFYAAAALIESHVGWLSIGVHMKRYPNPAECDYADPGNRLFTVIFTTASASSIRQQIGQIKAHRAGLSADTTSGFAHD